MSQFEFVSVGLALVYSFAVARLLNALPHALQRERRYWLHLVWFAIVLIALAGTWWQIWLFRDVAWNPGRFVWALSIPSLIYLRIGALVSQDPARVGSWREHFYRTRVAFFGIGLVIVGNAILAPWLMGLVPWWTATDYHSFPAFLVVLYAVGIATARPGVHAVIGVLNLVTLSGGMAYATWLGDMPL